VWDAGVGLGLGFEWEFGERRRSTENQHLGAAKRETRVRRDSTQQGVGLAADPASYYMDRL
jgi:hypothetical protein